MQLKYGRVRYTQINSHAILVGPQIRENEQGTALLCSGVLVHQALLFELAYFVTHDFQLRRSVLAF
jgi:hypothetical protein